MKALLRYLVLPLCVAATVLLVWEGNLAWLIAVPVIILLIDLIRRSK